MHTVRYVESTEYTIDSATKTKIATFTLTPGDASNNAILDYQFYFEYKGTTTTDLYLKYEIDIHGAAGPGEGSSHFGPWMEEVKGTMPDYILTHVQEVPTGIDLRPIPNQSQYTVEVYFCRATGDTAYIRNFNFLMTYVDGLPSS